MTYVDHVVECRCQGDSIWVRQKELGIQEIHSIPISIRCGGAFKWGIAA